MTFGQETLLDEKIREVRAEIDRRFRSGESPLSISLSMEFPYEAVTEHLGFTEDRQGIFTECPPSDKRLIREVQKKHKKEGMIPCILCGEPIEGKTACGLEECESCCVRCYLGDAPCTDILPEIFREMEKRVVYRDYLMGTSHREISKKYGITLPQVNNIILQENAKNRKATHGAGK